MRWSARSRADRAAITAALDASTFSDHFMPYGPTKFVNGQNQGAQPLMTQVLKGDIKVIVPRDYREAEPVFPLQGLTGRRTRCSSSASSSRRSSTG